MSIKGLSLITALVVAVPVTFAFLRSGPGETPADGTAERAVAETGDDEVVGPGPAPVDVFHPGREKPAPARYGGRVIVHIASLPENVNYVVENSAVTRRFLYEVHESLLIQDWEHHDFRPAAAEKFTTEDLVVLKTGADARYDGVVDARVKVKGEVEEGAPAHRAVRAVYGEVNEEDEAYVVTPKSKGSALAAPVRVAKGDVEAVERGAVFTFELRPGMRWHPAEGITDQTLDARDVHFSWTVYSNPGVDCDEKRFQFQKITGGEIVDPLTVRFFYEEQYAFAVSAIGRSMTLLPSHIYDLSDPDCPWHAESFTPEQEAKHINENPHNQMWVGLGPYRITAWTQQYVEAERFWNAEGTDTQYFDKDNAGYFDTIRWRYIDDDNTALNAVMNRELDFFERVKSADYFGEATQKEAFTDSFYKGYKYLGTYGYTGWNMYRPELAELAVRKALAYAFDFEEYKRTNYKDLCNQITGPLPYNSAAYNHEVKPFPYDVEMAQELLDEAEWYDSNGNGVIDKNGVELEIEFLMPSGNDASKNFGLKLQESLAELGIKLDIVQLEWATFLEKFKSREFDSANLAWVPELESDPEQLWHSKWGAYEVRGSNNSGVMDPYVDELIAKGQKELDTAKRMEIWREMHRYLYHEVQPYLFMYNVPQKFSMSKRVRGFQAVAIDPGYIIRRWYFADPTEAGTRTTRERRR